MLFKKLRLVIVLGLFVSGLLACGGDSDSGSSDTPKPIISDGVVEAYDPDVLSMMVEDNGVVSEEEIYKNWPEEVASANAESLLADLISSGQFL